MKQLVDFLVKAICLSILLIFTILVVIIFLTLCIEVNRIVEFKDVQWASWFSSIPAIIAVIYTRNIWINNILREELNTIVSYHYKYLYSYLPPNIENINENDNALSLNREIDHYYNASKVNDFKPNLSDYIGYIESIKLTNKGLNNENLELLVKDLNEIYKYHKEFVYYMESFFNEKNPELESIFIQQADSIYRLLIVIMKNYLSHYTELKNNYHRIYKI